MTPTPAQAEALKRIIAWWLDPHGPQVFYLAGYAGTGKSTLYRLVREALRELKRRQLKRDILIAYTGKAANVLRQKGNDHAMTMHSAIYTLDGDDGNGQPRFVLNDKGAAAEADLITIDEGSMISREHAEDILSFGKRVLVMGDPGQLPPVGGQGYFTSREPDVFLTDVMRQALDSPIIWAATHVRGGRPINPGSSADGALRVLVHGPASTEEIIRPETQVLCGVHRVRWGYTATVRRARGFEGPLPLAGEQLICCKNDRDLGIFNGSFGTAVTNAEVMRDQEGDFTRLLHLTTNMEDLDSDYSPMIVHPWLFEQHADANVKRPFKVRKGIQEFDWGYILTCHKAQGSEWPDVTVIDDSGVFKEDRWRWLYTALTRASERVTLLRRISR